MLIFLYAAPLAHLLAGSFFDSKGFTLKAYAEVLGDAYGLSLIWNSVRLGLITTGLTLIVGYPAAFGLAMSRGRLRSLFLAALFLPLAASVIAKAFAWTILLRSHGVVNDTLLFLHLTNKPIRMIFTQTSLIVGAANIFLPFMILPIYAVVSQIDSRLTEAAATLGASPVSAFLRVVAPLSAPGVIAGRFVGVFALRLRLCRAQSADGRKLSDAGDNHRQGVPADPRSRARRGGGRDSDGDWAHGRCGEPAVRAKRRAGQVTGAIARIVAIGCMAAATLFLLAPLLVIAAASFSPTPVFDLPTDGASLRWYGAVGSLDGFWPALALSLEIAVLSTAISLGIGTLAGIAITRGLMPGAGSSPPRSPRP